MFFSIIHGIIPLFFNTNMKKFLFASLFLVLATPSFSSAATDEDIGKSCSEIGVDIMANVPDDADWNEVYIVRANDGSMWQRAILDPRLDEVLEVVEGETTTISGTGQTGLANSEGNDVQILLFAPEDNGTGGVKKPSASGNCYYAGKTDQNGYFEFNIHARMLWANAEENIIVDAFTRLEDSWDQQMDEDENQDFYIGTNYPYREATVKLLGSNEDIPASCEEMCPDSPYIRCSVVRPDDFRYVARGAFPFQVGQNNNTLVDELHIAKLTPLTFYVLTSDNSNEVPDGTLETYVDRALTVELMKRIILGVNGGIPSPVSALNTKNLLAFEDEDDSEIKTFIYALRDLITLNEVDAQREASLDVVKQYVDKIFPEDIANYSVPTKEFLSEVFPAADTQPGDFGTRSDDAWAQDILNIFDLWTNSSNEVNECLMLADDKPYRYFQLSPEEDMILPEDAPAVGCAEIENNTSPRGTDPVLMINTDESVTVEPNFVDMLITRANRLFSIAQQWNFVSQKEDFVSFEYLPRAEFSPAIVSQSCVSRADVPEYADLLEESFGLPEYADEIIEKELYTQIPRDSGYHSVGIAEPSDIAQRISWLFNGEAVDIPQLYFQVTSGSCTVKNLENPRSEVQNTFQNASDIAFEVGVL